MKSTTELNSDQPYCFKGELIRTYALWNAVPNIQVLNANRNILRRLVINNNVLLFLHTRLNTHLLLFTVFVNGFRCSHASPITYGTVFYEEVTIFTHGSSMWYEIKEVRNLSKLQQLFWHMAVHTLWSCVMRIEKTAQSIAHI